MWLVLLEQSTHAHVMADETVTAWKLNITTAIWIALVSISVWNYNNGTFETLTVFYIH
jgi:hypothetical protein